MKWTSKSVDILGEDGVKVSEQFLRRRFPQQVKGWIEEDVTPTDWNATPMNFQPGKTNSAVDTPEGRYTATSGGGTHNVGTRIVGEAQMLLD